MAATTQALLLRHLEGCERRQPPSSDLALAELQREWPGYRKGMSRIELQRRLGREPVRRAAAVEPDLAMVLSAIGLVP